MNIRRKLHFCSTTLFLSVQQRKNYQKIQKLSAHSKAFKCEITNVRWQQLKVSALEDGVQCDRNSLRDQRASLSHHF
jgi:hypothetical protein